MSLRGKKIKLSSLTQMGWIKLTYLSFGVLILANGRKRLIYSTTHSQVMYEYEVGRYQ